MHKGEGGKGVGRWDTIIVGLLFVSLIACLFILVFV